MVFGSNWPNFDMSPSEESKRNWLALLNQVVGFIFESGKYPAAEFVAKGLQISQFSSGLDPIRGANKMGAFWPPFYY
jgi:hypothetical protein